MNGLACVNHIHFIFSFNHMRAHESSMEKTRSKQCMFLESAHRGKIWPAKILDTIRVFSSFRICSGDPARPGSPVHFFHQGSSVPPLRRSTWRTSWWLRETRFVAPTPAAPGTSADALLGRPRAYTIRWFMVTMVVGIGWVCHIIIYPSSTSSITGLQVTGKTSPNILQIYKSRKVAGARQSRHPENISERD